MKRFGVILSLVLGACYIRAGQHVDEFPPAFRANGIRATVLLSSNARIAGELLAVSGDTALVVLTANALSLVPLTAIQQGQFDYPDACPDCRLRSDRNRAWKGMSWPVSTNDLRTLSRFPLGLPSAELTRLLAEKKQSAATVIR